MKRQVKILIILALGLMVLFGSASGAKAASLKKKKIKLNVGTSYQLKMKGIGKKKVKWKSSKKSVAKVSKKGLVKAKKPGKATITAKVGSKKYKCKVTVLGKAGINASVIRLCVGNTYQLKITNAASKVKWKSSNKSVASVSKKKGLVKAKKAGTAKITAKVGKVKFTCDVTVVNEVSISSHSITLSEGNSHQLELNGAVSGVAWSSSNTRTATVTESGKVTGVKAGTANVTARLDGVTYSCSVTVKAQETRTTTVTRTVTRETEVGVVEEPVVVDKVTTPASKINKKSLSTDTPAKEKKVLQAMLKLKKRFPEGYPYSNATYYQWKGGFYRGGYGCAGFAFMLSDAAFTEPAERFSLPGYIQHIRVGDIIRLNYDTHSVIVLRVESDHVIVAEGNYNKSVHWGRKISFDVLRETGTHVMTRYKEVPDAEKMSLYEQIPFLPDLYDYNE